jgi:hypothetical protein
MLFRISDFVGGFGPFFLVILDVLPGDQKTRKCSKTRLKREELVPIEGELATT